jgi:exodeoxyribonuclease VIII
MKVGNAFHTLTLEPHKFDDKVIVGEWNLRTKADKKEYEELNKGEKVVIRQAWMDDMKLMAGSVRNHQNARSLIDGAIIERSTFWLDQGVTDGMATYDATEILCKVRPDMDLPDMGWLGDLKSAKDADYINFRKEIANRFYHAQAAFYLDIRNMQAGEQAYSKFAWLVVEKTPPFLVAIYAVHIDSDLILKGREIYRKNLALYAQCKQYNIWPGYGSGEIVEIELPPWAL